MESFIKENITDFFSEILVIFTLKPVKIAHLNASKLVKNSFFGILDKYSFLGEYRTVLLWVS